MLTEKNLTTIISGAVDFNLSNIKQSFEAQQYTNEEYSSFLFFAVRQVEISGEILEYLYYQIRHCFYLQDSQGAIPLHYLCQNPGITPEIIAFLSEKTPEHFIVRNKKYDMPLHYLCSNYKITREIIASLSETTLSNFNESDFWGHAPLHMLCVNSSISLEIIEFLWEKIPAYFNKKDKNHRTPVHELCLNKYIALDIIEFLWKKMPEYFNEKDKIGLSPLYEFCKSKIIAKITSETMASLPQMMLESFKETNPRQIPPMHELCRNNKINSETIDFLSKTIPLSFNKKDNYNETPLSELCRNESVTLKMLTTLLDISREGFKEKNSLRRQRTALHILCQNSAITLEIVELLLEKIAEYFNEKDQYEVTPLRELFRNKKITPEIMALVCKKMPKSLIEKNCSGAMPLHDLCENKAVALQIIKALPEEIFQFLKEKDKYGFSPLHYLAGDEAYEILGYCFDKLGEGVSECLLFEKRVHLRNPALEKISVKSNQLELGAKINLCQLNYYAKYYIQNFEQLLSSHQEKLYKKCSMKLEQYNQSIDEIAKIIFGDAITGGNDFSELLRLLKIPNIFNGCRPEKRSNDYIDNDSYSHQLITITDYSLLQFMLFKCKDAKLIKYIAACHGKNLIASLDREDGFGRKCLHLAVLNDNATAETIEYLIELGVPANASSKDNKNSLHYACSNNEINLEIIKLLIQSGASVEQKDSAGRTPLEYISREIESRSSIIRTIMQFDKEFQNKEKPGVIHRGKFHFFSQQREMEPEDAKVFKNTTTCFL